MSGKNNIKKRIVVSGANIRYGGNLSVFYDCLDELVKHREYTIVAFVCDEDLFLKYKDTIQIVECKKVLNSYLRRLAYEYFYYKVYSKKNDVYLWLSLNDFSPNVIAKRRYTYCHNPLPFYSMRVKDISLDKMTYLMSKFFKIIYRINIKKINGIVVQQTWMRDRFIEEFHLKVNDIIVAKPEIKDEIINSEQISTSEYSFIYPVYPRPFKKIEDVCFAFEMVCKMCKEKKLKLILTFVGNENKYSEKIYSQYRMSNCIQFIGFKKRKEILELYKKCNCLVFSSELETWGMPISEFKVTGKEMILVDYRYAHEALGKYEKVLFYNPNDIESLVNAMSKVVNGITVYEGNEDVKIEEPYAKNWKGLFELLMENK